MRRLFEPMKRRESPDHENRERGSGNRQDFSYKRRGGRDDTPVGPGQM